MLIRCAYCQGTGRQACGSEGCPKCDGQGALTCAACEGKGASCPCEGCAGGGFVDVTTLA
ncbi:MAG: hypothetical protein FJX76_04925 [Armatimonadetes bacterium]|nr:hypothetical protein [Armatimonadota bacterium]